MVIHAKNRPEKKYHLNKDDEEQIIEIWAWLKKKEIYTSEFPEELDVAIWLDTDAMESFFEYFGNEENPVLKNGCGFLSIFILEIFFQFIFIFKNEGRKSDV